MVPNTHAVRYQDRRQTVAKLVERLPDDVWETVTIGPSGDQQVWACLPLSESCAPGMRRWLLIRRSGDDGDDLRFFLAYGAEDTSEVELLRVCGVRWQIEECFAQAKGEVGPGPVRGADLGRVASLRDPLPARACRPGRDAPGRQPA